MEKAILKLLQAWLQKEIQQRFKFLTILDANKCRNYFNYYIQNIMWFIVYLVSVQFE